MINSIVIHGRQPALGRAELESLFSADNIQPIGEIATGLSLTADQIPFRRLGGTVKLARIITILETASWKEIEQHLTGMAGHHSSYLPPGKMSLGLSAYGFSVSPAQINATALSLKKVIRKTGRPVRVVPNKASNLSSAQVFHNGLTGERAWELIIVRHGQQTYLAQTTKVQDIEAYAARDQARPMRDARVGMLPPKLAQIIINLARGELEQSAINSQKSTVLDPFCGTGVILQEAVLSDYNAYGTDLEERMVEYSRINLDWIIKKHAIAAKIRIEQADATKDLWSPMPQMIASETYLGRPFSALPKPDVLQEVVRDVDTIHKKFLRNVAKQAKSGFRMCIAVPAWVQTSKFRHLPMLDHLTDMGYNRLSFVHARDEELIYHRDNQIVGRELIVLQRK